jgi:hypothetical protein
LARLPEPDSFPSDGAALTVIAALLDGYKAR